MTVILISSQLFRKYLTGWPSFIHSYQIILFTHSSLSLPPLFLKYLLAEDLHLASLEAESILEAGEFLETMQDYLDSSVISIIEDFSNLNEVRYALCTGRGTVFWVPRHGSRNVKAPVKEMNTSFLLTRLWAMPICNHSLLSSVCMPLWFCLIFTLGWQRTVGEVQNPLNIWRPI